VPATDDQPTVDGPALWFEVLTPRNWPDLERLLGPDGGDRGCWCRWWRHEPAEYDAMPAEARHRATAAGAGVNLSGVLAYGAEGAIGWCAIGPGEESLPRRTRSRSWHPIDDSAVWSITCFFVDPAVRHQHAAAQLLAAAVDIATRAGATVVEAYPRDTRGDALPDRALYFGSLGMFLDAGFSEVARGMDAFPVVRLTVA
jgi:GNAT superfamily N-acetyltransferase